MKLKAVFFDLDNTLLDHSKTEMEAKKEIYKMYRKIFKDVTFEDFHEAYVKHNNRLWDLLTEEKITKEYLRLHRVKDSLEELNLNSEKSLEISCKYIEIYSQGFHLIEGAIEVLEELKNEFQLGIITNGFDEVQKIKLEKTGLAKYFQSVVCSEDVGKMKPHPSIFDFAVKSLNSKTDESIYIGDNYLTDIVGGKDFGMKTVYLNPKNNVVKDSVADFEIKDIKEVLSILL